ncbi:MAG: phosphoribosylglycinamide formyltransferase, partial [Schwartzia sp.]|nr:phosphoribosylglycinamide formyltransferase [Schwartzia sp. (in: firmicutes)]
CSGRGTNLQSNLAAVDSGQIPAPVGLVLTDKPGVMALTRAEKAGIPHRCIDRKHCASQREFEEQLVAALKEHHVSLVVLAGFMRILSPYFVHEFAGRILNIHPALLPAFPGAHAHRDVLAYGVKVSGVTIHFVDEGMDSGPIILQAAVPVEDDDTEDTLAARVLVEEHKLYPRAIELYLKGRLKVEGRKVRILPQP